MDIGRQRFRMTSLKKQVFGLPVPLVHFRVSSINSVKLSIVCNQVKAGPSRRQTAMS